MPLSLFDKKCQAKILYLLGEVFPEPILNRNMDESFPDEIEKLKFNRVYMADLGLIASTSRRDENGKLAHGYRATATGIDRLLAEL